MSDPSGTGTVFVSGGALAGAGVASTFGSAGLVGSFGGISVGAIPIVGAGAIAGAAIYGTGQAIADGDPVAISALGLGALGGTSISAAIGGVGLSGGFGAISIGMGTMATLGGVVGLGVYGIARMLNKSVSRESASQVFARMEDKICWQEAYISALLELDDFLTGEDIKRRFRELEADDELQRLKVEVNRRKAVSQAIPAPPSTSGNVPRLSYSPKALTISSPPEVWLQVHSLHHHAGTVSAIAFHPENHILATASHDHSINLLDMKTGDRLYTFYLADSVLSVSFSPDGKTLLCGGLDCTVTSWNLKTRQLLNIHFVPGETGSHAGAVYSLACTADSQTVISGSADETVRLWYLSSGRLKRTLSGHQNTTLSITVSRDGQTIVAGGSDRTVRVWKLVGGQVRPQIFSGHTGRVTSVTLTPNEQVVISGSTDRTIKLWHLETGALLYNALGHTAGIITVTMSPDGKTLASSSQDGTIKLWKVVKAQSGNLELQPLYTLIGHGTIAFSPDGTTLACGGQKGIVNIWQLLR